MACRTGDLSTLQTLLGYSSQPISPSHILQKAAQNGYVEIVRYLLNLYHSLLPGGGHVSMAMESGSTAIHELMLVRNPAI